MHDVINCSACEKSFHHLTHTNVEQFVCCTHQSSWPHSAHCSVRPPLVGTRPRSMLRPPHPINELDAPLGVWGVVITPLACDSVLLLHVCFAHICAFETLVTIRSMHLPIALHPL